MSPLARLLQDVDGSVRRASQPWRARTLGRITDLFVGGADALSAEQVALFDGVIQRFTVAIETRARVELATRLARMPNAPPGTILSLANDEIVVARPVLTVSPRLDDQALMAIALDRGRDHMLAICERPAVSAPVTDVLVSHGDGQVRHAIAGNHGARFSLAGTATLIDHARQDGGLVDLLGNRPDLSPRETAQLVEIAKATARRHLLALLPGSGEDVSAAVERGADALRNPAGRPRDEAGDEAATERWPAGRALAESDVLAFAEGGRTEEAIAAIASLAALPLPAVARIFEERDNELLIVVGKAGGWSWRTVRALLRLRDPALTERHHFRRAEETFDRLASSNARRVLHVLRLRETPGGGAVRS